MKTACKIRKNPKILNDYFEFFRLEKFPKVNWRQELQRLGRLFHSEFKGEHHITMTEEEYILYKKRLYGILEKGFEINIHREGSG